MAKYTITFNETEDLENVKIDVVGEDKLKTDENGQVEIELEDGEYEFTTSKSQYEDYEGNFEVDGEEKTVHFTMDRINRFDGIFSTTMRSFVEALEDRSFNVVVGSKDYDKLTYPVVQYVPDTADYVGNGEYEEIHTLFFMFERGKRKSKLIDYVEQVEEIQEKIEQELGQVQCVTEYKPTAFRYLVAEYSNDMLNVIRVDWRVRHLVNYG